jgi:hypothetical protein
MQWKCNNLQLFLLVMKAPVYILVCTVCALCNLLVVQLSIFMFPVCTKKYCDGEKSIRSYDGFICFQHAWTYRKFILRNVLRLLIHTYIASTWTFWRMLVILSKKGKSISITGHGDPQGCVTSRLPHFLNSWLTGGGKVVSLMHQPPFTLRKIPGNHFC